MKAMTQKKLLVGLIVLCAIQFIAQKGFDSEEREELSSKGRSTQLGKPVVKSTPAKEMEVIMNDPAMSSAWGIKMTDSQKAWRISQGSKDIKVCVIDTGADMNHPDLKNNFWTNPGETGTDKFGRNKATNGVDDDGDGFVDDVHGWNFVSNSNKLDDEHGHGTHIAGIIGAEGGNGIGVVGVSPKVSLVILKYYDSKGSDVNNLVNTVKAIDYSVKVGCNIINYSGGGIAPSNEEKAAIDRAAKKGILFVAAAGNERSNSDVRKYYPADYGLPNIISVTAIDRFKQVLQSSNFGEKTVDIAAPGNDIISTLPNGQYGFMTGTSQATAFASGVAALVMANNTELRTASAVIKYLTQTGDDDEKLAGKTRWRKRLNSYKALAIQDSDLAVSGVRIDQAQNFDKNAFASPTSEVLDSDSETESSETKITAFGRKISNHLGMKTVPALIHGSPEAAND